MKGQAVRGAELKRIRRQMQMTQRELQIALGYSDDNGRTIRAWEAEHRKIPNRAEATLKILQAAIAPEKGHAN